MTKTPGKRGRPPKTPEQRDNDAWERFADNLHVVEDPDHPGRDEEKQHWFIEGRFPMPRTIPVRWMSAARYAWVGGPWKGKKLTDNDSLVRTCSAAGCIRPEHQKLIKNTTTEEQRKNNARKADAARKHRKHMREWGAHLEKIS